MGNIHRLNIREIACFCSGSRGQYFHKLQPTRILGKACPEALNNVLLLTQFQIMASLLIESNITLHVDNNSKLVLILQFDALCCLSSP